MWWSEMGGLGAHSSTSASAKIHLFFACYFLESFPQTAWDPVLMRVGIDFHSSPVLSLLFPCSGSGICKFWAKFCDFGDHVQGLPVLFPVIRQEHGF